MHFFESPYVAKRIAEMQTKKPNTITYIGDLKKGIVFEVENIDQWRHSSLQTKGAMGEHAMSFHKREISNTGTDTTLSHTRLGIRTYLSIESLEMEFDFIELHGEERETILEKSKRFFKNSTLFDDEIYCKWFSVEWVAKGKYKGDSYHVDGLERVWSDTTENAEKRAYENVRERMMDRIKVDIKKKNFDILKVTTTTNDYKL